MNEYSILFNLLTQRASENGVDTIGVPEKKLLEVLKFTGKNDNIRLHKKLEEFSKNIHIFGLKLRRNPIWPVAQNEQFRAQPT